MCIIYQTIQGQTAKVCVAVTKGAELISQLYKRGNTITSVKVG